MAILRKIQTGWPVRRGPVIPKSVPVKRGPFVPSFVAEITAKSRQQKIFEETQMLKQDPFREGLPIKRGPVAYTPESNLRALRKAGIGVA